MKNNHKCIELVCDGGTQYGIGHIRRSITLANELAKRGYQIRFSAASEQGQQQLTSINVTYTSDLTSLLRILDFPYPIDDWIEKKAPLPVVALDYFGDQPVDLVVSVYEHRIPVPPGRRLSGLEYALIRPEITVLAEQSSLCSDNVLVMIGGSDINRDGEAVAEKLVHFGMDVQLIRGPGVEKDYEVQSEKVSILHMPEDIEKRMSMCQWAVTNGGSSMMEMMCLGKAVHVIPQTDAELHLAELVMEQGGILGIGLERLETPSQQEIDQIGRRAREIVDGRGVERIADLIEGCLPHE